MEDKRTKKSRFESNRLNARSRKPERRATMDSMILTGVGILGASLNIANSIIGGATLELPYIMSHFGIIITILFLIFVWFLTITNMLRLIACKDYAGTDDYKSLARYAFKSAGERLINMCLLINNFGICIGYLIIFDDSVTRILIKGFDVTDYGVLTMRWF